MKTLFEEATHFKEPKNLPSYPGSITPGPHVSMGRPSLIRWARQVHSVVKRFAQLPTTVVPWRYARSILDFVGDHPRVPPIMPNPELYFVLKTDHCYCIP